MSARKRDVSESDTVVIIGDMLADILEYAKYVEVSTEFAVKGTFVDLAVKVGSDIHFLVEAKAIGVELKDLHIRQAVDYGANQGVEWAILTNGAVWRIYRIEFKKPIGHVLVAEVDLLSAGLNADDAVEFFVPVTFSGRVVGVALMHLVPLFIIPLVIVRLVRTLVEDEHAFTHAEQEQIKADLAAIKKALKIDG